MSYKEISFKDTSMQIAELLIAQLADLQYEGFEETDNGLKAYIDETLFDKEPLDKLARELNVGYSVGILPDTNWNALWESNFHPVIVEGFCAIRADFHEPINNVQHEIVITPKMSFGTGHHPTTYMMIQQMEQIGFSNKSVMDFGTGTGVLAILAQKLGAREILAIDNDDWSITNADENIKRNSADKIELIKADTALANKKYDVILANITRNVILKNFALFSSDIREDGALLLSGLLADDEEIILAEAREKGFSLIHKIQRNNWISLRLQPYQHHVEKKSI